MFTRTTGHECPDTSIDIKIPDIYQEFALRGRAINGRYVKTNKFRNGKVSYRKADTENGDYQAQGAMVRLDITISSYN